MPAGNFRKDRFGGPGPELEISDDDLAVLPSRVHAIVLVSGWHRATRRAVLFARVTHPDTFTALTVNVDDAETRALHRDWERHHVAIPLTVTPWSR
ncbi:hypothetical protein AB0E01_40555 [Nocardia vinacea]|uniref:hypothetical protein n=1 Tax=Nocardia vinacea TaxID=96468 RepID=UPI0033CC992B